MDVLRLPIKIVFYKEGELWIAHCLEFNLVGDGHTKSDALGSLVHFIRCQVESSAKYSSPANLFSPARGRYYRMFAEGNDVDEMDVVVLKDDLKGMVEDASFREYAGETVPA